MEHFEKITMELQNGVRVHQHPFRSFVFTTQSTYPESRTVVLRDIVQQHHLVFYCDERSLKVHEISVNNHVSALFYHPEQKMQVRIKGRAELENKKSTIYKESLKAIKERKATRDYTSLHPPGTTIDSFHAAYGEEIHFSVVRMIPKSIEALWLRSDQHLRMKFTLHKNEWKGQILVP